MPRVLVGVPTSTSQIHSSTVKCLLSLQALHPDICVFFFSPLTLLSASRSAIVHKAQSENCSHVLFVDSDMIFPADGLEKFLEADVAIIGANYSTRVAPFRPTARVNGNYVQSSSEDTIQKVDVLGLGFTLINRQVFEQIPEPWFSVIWGGTCYVGEDVFFLNMALNRGYKPYVHHGVSRNVYHVGWKAYALEAAG